MGELETVLHSTLETSRKKLYMAAIKSHALMAWQFATNRVNYETTGKDISNPLVTGRNPNVTSYQYYDQLPVAQTNEFDTVRYNWARVGGTAIISDQEQDENVGSAMIFKLLKGKMDVLEESIKEKFSSYLFGAGGGTDPEGLSSLIPDDPTTGIVGGINRATETQWRTSSYDFLGTLTSTNIEEALDDVLMDLKIKSDKPSIIIGGRNVYRLYRSAVRDKLVVNLGELKGGNGMVDLGFAGVAHDAIPFIYDEDCDVDKAYLINDKYLRLHILKHVNMKIKKLTSPWNIDAIGRRIIWQGQFCMWRAYRTHAVIKI